MKKVLSVLLILAAAFGFYGGAVSLNDVLACKEYWEEEGEKTTADLNKLEDGLDELGENTEAYLDGVDQVAEGEKDLAKGVKDYNAGKKTLKAGKKTLKDNASAIAMVRQLVAGIDQYNAGAKTWGSNFEGLGLIQNAVADYYLDNISPTSNTGLKKLIDDNLGSPTSDAIAGILGNYGSCQGLYAVSDYINQLANGLDGAITYHGASYENAAEELGYLKGADGVLTAKKYKKSFEALQSAGVAQIPAGAAQIIGGILQSGNAELINGLNAAYNRQVYPALKGKLGAYLPNNVADFTKATTWTGTETNPVPLDVFYAMSQGLDQLFTGIKGQVTPLIAEYEAGQQAVKKGEKDLKSGAKKLAQGRRDLADGKSQLAEYEDGEQQIRDGLKTLMDTEANGGLTPIAERVGEDEDFSQTDGNLDFDAGYTGVEEGRNYSADSGVLITKELTQRGVGMGLGIGAGVAAVLAAILGFLKKNKGAGVLGLIAAAAAAAGAIVTNAAGLEFSEIAGSALGSMPMIALGVLAVVALVHAIAYFAAPKTAA